MRKLVFRVPAEYNGVTLRGFLRSRVHLSARLTAKLKRVPNGITRNGERITAPERLFAGEEIVLMLPDGEQSATPVPFPIEIRYEDEDVLVCEKPSGMPMYPCPGHDADSLANAVAWLQLQRGESAAFRPVYRLDRDTTGLVVLAKNQFAAYSLARSVRKTYLAVCEGILEGSGTIRLPIALAPGHTVQRCVSPEGEPAETRWRALRRCGNNTLAAMRLKTGRTHQIRVHFAAVGHPLAGDDMYGGSRGEIGRQALHCAEVRFRSPVGGKLRRVRSPFPADFEKLVNCNRKPNE